MKKNKNIVGAVLVLAAGIMWGHTGFFVNRQTAFGVSEVGIAMLRLCLGFFFMALYMVLFQRKKFRIPKKALLFAALAGTIGMVTCSVVYFYAINLTSPSVATVLMYTSPAFVVVVSFFLYKEKITLKKTVCILLSFAGAVLVTNLIGGKITYSALGLLFGLITGISYALYSIFAGHSMKCGAEPESVIFYALGFSAFWVLIYALATGNAAPTIHIVTTNVKPLLYAILQSTFDCIAPYILYTIGVRYTGASKASIMSTMELVMGAIIGAVSLGEKLGVVGYAGIVLVIVSIVLLNIGEDADTSSEASADPDLPEQQKTNC